MPDGITTDPQHISDAGADICSALVTDYLAALPADPLTGPAFTQDQCSGPYDTNYTVVSSSTNNRVTVAAPVAELDASISATR